MTKQKMWIIQPEAGKRKVVRGRRLEIGTVQLFKCNQLGELI
jgi:hypothetical protein